MKKFLIGLGVVFLVIIVAMGGFGLFASMKINNMIPSVERAVNQFYISGNYENYDDLYSSSDEKMKKAASIDDFKKYMKGISVKLGVEKLHVKGAYRLNYVEDGTYFGIQYSTTREKGSAIESFVFRQDKQPFKWKLVSYNINSKDLIQQ